MLHWTLHFMMGGIIISFQEGETILLTAWKKNKLQLVQRLLSMGANPEIANKVSHCCFDLRSSKAAVCTVWGNPRQHCSRWRPKRTFAEASENSRPKNGLPFKQNSLHYFVSLRSVTMTNYVLHWKSSQRIKNQSAYLTKLLPESDRLLLRVLFYCSWASQFC